MLTRAALLALGAVRTLAPAYRRGLTAALLRKQRADAGRVGLAAC